MTAQAPRGLGRIFDLTSNPNTQRRDDSRDEELRQMQAQVGAGAGARMIKDLSVSTGKLIIDHKLGKKVTGWRVADIDSTNVTIKRVATANEAKWLGLQATGDAVISVEVW